MSKGYVCPGCGAPIGAPLLEEVGGVQNCASCNTPVIWGEDADRWIQVKDPRIPGMKFDNDKPRWDLLPWTEVEEVVKVLTHGAKKYDDHNWQKVEPAKQRYFSAALRHMVAWFNGEKIDQDSGRHHLACAICSLLFLMWKDNQ